MMNDRIAIMLFLLISLGICSCTRTSGEPDTEDSSFSPHLLTYNKSNDGWIATLKKKPDGSIVKTGLMVIFNPDGSVDKIESTLDNQSNGPCWEYENGKIVTRGQYKNGKPVGTWRLWDKEGKEHDKVITVEEAPQSASPSR